MAERWSTAGWVFAVGLLGGLAGYAGPFLSIGSSPSSMQLGPLARAGLSTGVLLAAALVGYARFDPPTVTRGPAAVVGLFLVSGVVGYALMLVALLVAPPAGFSLGSVAVTAGVVLLREVLPFAIAGFAGAAVRVVSASPRP